MLEQEKELACRKCEEKSAEYEVLMQKKSGELEELEERYFMQDINQDKLVAQLNKLKSEFAEQSGLLSDASLQLCECQARISLQKEQLQRCLQAKDSLVRDNEELNRELNDLGEVLKKERGLTEENVVLTISLRKAGKEAAAELERLQQENSYLKLSLAEQAGDREQELRRAEALEKKVAEYEGQLEELEAENKELKSNDMQDSSNEGVSSHRRCRSKLMLESYHSIADLARDEEESKQFEDEPSDEPNAEMVLLRERLDELSRENASLYGRLEESQGLLEARLAERDEALARVAQANANLMATRQQLELL
jgi:hypothetical protein